MEKILIYPAIFHRDKEAGHGYLVEFPDLPGCVTEGETLEEAFLMAGDALDCWFSDSEQNHPKPTPITEIKAEEGAVVQMVRSAPYLSEGAKQYFIEEAIENGQKEGKGNKTVGKRIYPAIFHKEDGAQYSVVFPDLGCVTCGKTPEEAFKMAKEALALWLDDCDPVDPTPLEQIKAEGGDRVMLVEADDGDDIVYLKNSEVPRGAL